MYICGGVSPIHCSVGCVNGVVVWAIVCVGGYCVCVCVCVCADPRMSAKVALTPQRKSFGGGCSWRNKVGGSESHEDGTDGGQSSLVRREEAGLYAFDEEEEEDATKGPDGEYGFARVGYGKAGQYLGHAPHPLPAGVDKGSDRAARVPRKIDHVPLRDQARREDYGGGREEQRDYHRDKVGSACYPSLYITRCILLVEQHVTIQ